MRSRGIVAVIGGLALILCSISRAQDQTGNEGVVRFRSASQQNVNGKRRLVISGDIPGKGAVQIEVPNNDETRPGYDPRRDLADSIKELKPGALIKVSLDNVRPLPILRAIDPYEMAKGEDTPNGYVFRGSDVQTVGRVKTPVVELSKFGQTATLLIATRKNDKGEVEADPDLMAAINLMKDGDAVWAQINGKTLTAIDLYKDPDTGKLLKLGDTDIDGHKTKSADVDQKGKTITLLVPLHQNGKIWTPDVAILRELQKIRPNTQVEYRIREDGDKLWLREIQPAPKQPVEPKKGTTK
ncbi:MAG TPA: hypothetical protein VH370_07780 [Humisphaera sp.]|jgi:hypothetical protein|nr:hypothetical protein [Humisphaera sp.]